MQIGYTVDKSLLSIHNRPQIVDNSVDTVDICTHIHAFVYAFRENGLCLCRLNGVLLCMAQNMLTSR